MHYKKTTQTPNTLFDEILKTLSNSELKVLLTIIRKTIGMVDSRDSSKRLERAWISQKLFMLCTNLSGRAVSTAIDSLVTRKLIIVTDAKKNILSSKSSRRGVSKLYYSSNSLLDTPQEKKASELTSHNPVKKGHTIKLTYIKPSCDISSQTNKKLSDKERLLQIIQKPTTSNINVTTS